MTPAEAAAILVALLREADYRDDVISGEELGISMPYVWGSPTEMCVDGSQLEAKTLRAIAEWMDHPAEVAAEAKRLLDA